MILGEIVIGRNGKSSSSQILEFLIEGKTIMEQVSTEDIDSLFLGFVFGSVISFSEEELGTSEVFVFGD
jgi:hypothetical protein